MPRNGTGSGYLTGKRWSIIPLARRWEFFASYYIYLTGFGKNRKLFEAALAWGFDSTSVKKFTERIYTTGLFVTVYGLSHSESCRGKLELTGPRDGNKSLVRV